MKTVQVDAKGLACPQPVVLSKNALTEISEGEVVVYLDSDVSKENVVRMARHVGCSVAVNEKEEGVFEVRITKVPSKEKSKGKAPQPNMAEGEIVYLFDSDFIGTNRELGKVLSNGFLNAIAALPNKKGSVVLISNGVRLATKGSYVLEQLSKLKDSGINILICGTCLDFFKIREKVKVGTVSNALEIMECLTSAAKVIKF